MPRAVLFLCAGLVGVLCGLFGAAWVLARARKGHVPIDHPDDRRLHQMPTPRTGGIGIPLAGVVVAVAFAVAGGSAGESRILLVVILVWSGSNGVIGWIDDHHPLRSRYKFVVQVVAAMCAVAAGLRVDLLAIPLLGPIELGMVSWPFSVLWLVWMANVFNFMDGMDALAAASGVVFFCAFAFVGHAAKLLALPCLALAIAGSLLGFLRYNRPPARIFMGDAGSLFAGGALGGLAVALAAPGSGGYPFTLSIVVVGTFVWDATFTIARRLLRGDPMRPHRTHLYQRLVLAGWSPRRVLWIYVGMAVLFCAAAVLSMGASAQQQAWVFAGACIVSLGLALVTSHLERASLRSSTGAR